MRQYGVNIRILANLHTVRYLSTSPENELTLSRVLKIMTEHLSYIKQVPSV